MSKPSVIKRSGICHHSTRAYQEGIVTRNSAANGIGNEIGGPSFESVMNAHGY